MWLGLALLGIIMFLFSGAVYKLWVGKEVVVDPKISFFMLVYTLVTSFGNCFIMLINGVGKIKIQMIVNVLSMVLFFPLSYLLSIHFSLGVVGIIIATIICSVYGPLIAPFEVKSILSKHKRPS